MNLSIYSSIKQASNKTGKTHIQIRNHVKYKHGKNIKTKCVVCGHQIKYSINRYLGRGNVCVNCNAKCNYVMKARKIHKKVIKEIEELTTILKDNNIKPDELFASIRFYDLFDACMQNK